MDHDHWCNFPDQIQYVYNSRGFRDAEWPWPDNLSDCIWCIGDSFTVGVGSAWHNTWPQILQRTTGRRCINVSLDGASNNWIARQVDMIVREIQPKTVVIHWSYLHRDENPDASLTDEDRRRPYIADISTNNQIDHFSNSVNIVRPLTKVSNIIHSFIPDSIPDCSDAILTQFWQKIRGVDWCSEYPLSVYEFERLPEFVKQELHELKMYHLFFHAASINSRIAKIIDAPFIPPLTPLDRARDGHHYDVLTATVLVNQVRRLMSLTTS
jgi:hypothetical protein